MHLLIKRSQRDDGIIWSSMIYELDTRLDLAPEETDLFAKYNLHSFVVYDSDAYTHHADAAYERFDDATKVPLWDPSLSQLASSLWNNVAGISHGIMTALSLRVTLGDLIAGSHVECDDLEQILVAEKNIVQAAEYLADYLAVALTFDGREELREL
jgi:hypothetical protein